MDNHICSSFEKAFKKEPIKYGDGVENFDVTSKQKKEILLKHIVN
jgi:hypothetical protein